MITFHKYQPVPFEVVERKGLGHPDTLADGISEAISRRLCRRYQEDFGQIMHHNVDKVLIIGGQSAPRFGGGEILEPPCVVVGGRATGLSGSSLEQEIVEASSDHIGKTVDKLTRFQVEPRTRQGAPELRSLIGKGANDTSIGVGFAPFSPLEDLVLRIEPAIARISGVGQDRKIMAVRSGEGLQLVVAAAMVDCVLGSRVEYEEAREKVRDAVAALAGESEVHVNAADHGDNLFLTVTGTSAEMGDDGATGRGNRGSGLITPMRPMTMEAIAGKNPVSHVGKIYNVMAHRAAQEIAKLEGVSEACITLVSRIGAPLDRPLVSSAYLSGEDSASVASEAQAIIDEELGNAESLLELFVAGKLSIY
ncbi:MAG: S-adenosylmethionine synthase [Methanosaeta sp. PtaB.Bin039]|nr:MAG: S-adenosylmethionine synthase [Methanosaeta sp. PtaB.Bin039]